MENHNHSFYIFLWSPFSCFFCLLLLFYAGTRMSSQSAESIDKKCNKIFQPINVGEEREMLTSISETCIRFRGFTRMNLEVTGQKVQTSSSRTALCILRTLTSPDTAVHHFAEFPLQATSLMQVSASVLSWAFSGYMSSIFSLSFTGSPSRVTWMF